MFLLQIISKIEDSQRIGFVESIISLTAMFLIIAGVPVFFHWLFKTRFGTKALLGTDLRQADMPVHLPIFVFLIWILASTLFAQIVEAFGFDASAWQEKFAAYLGIVIIEIFVIVIILIAAKRFFVGSLQSFGLNFKTWRKDLYAASLNFLAAWPFVILALWVVMQIGHWRFGPEFQMEQNEGLRVIVEYENLPLRVLTIFFAVLLTPIFEEFLFRGLLQSFLRNMGLGPWQSIIFVSIIFSALHPLMHFPALMILSMAMGYAYEKSNSILRPIFIHLIFNGITIAFALLG